MDFKVDIWKVLGWARVTLVNKPESLMMQEGHLGIGECVVRLAEVEKLIQEVVPLVDDLRAIADDGYIDADREAVIQRAQAFLASVAAWRTGQEKKEDVL